MAAFGEFSLANSGSEPTTKECLHDIGLEYDARKVAHSIAEYSTYQRICKTMAGEELSRAYTFGNDPKRRACHSS